MSDEEKNEMNTKETDIATWLKNKQLKKENTQEIGTIPW